MTTYTFGEDDQEPDTLIIQGVSYTMQPLGMGAMRRMLNGINASDNTEARLDAAIEMVAAVVIPEQREQLRTHIDETVSPQLLTQIATKLMGVQTDVDPTQPVSSSAGSGTTGSSSTDGAAQEALTLST